MSNSNKYISYIWFFFIKLRLDSLMTQNLRQKDYYKYKGESVLGGWEFQFAYICL